MNFVAVYLPETVNKIFLAPSVIIILENRHVRFGVVNDNLLEDMI